MTTDADWDDRRLSAAFIAMSSTIKAPADLPARTMTAIRATTVATGRPPSRWARVWPAAAALGTVAASMAIAVVLFGGPSPVGPVGTDGATASASQHAPLHSGDPEPPRVADLARLSVVDVLARIEAGPTADEVIVHGWLGRTSAVVDCEQVSNPHPLMPHCEEFGLFLMQEEADPDGRGRGLQPHVPFIVPMLRFDANVDATPLPGQAIEVLAVGHLLDHRWTSCPPAAAEECRDRFVIDRVVPADRVIAEIPEPWLYEADPHAVPAEVVPVIESVVGEIEVVSIGALPTDSVRLIDQAADLLIEQDGTELVWVVRALTSGATRTVATTYLVPAAPLRGGTALVYRITTAGAEELSVAAAPAPTAVFGLDVLSVAAAIDIRDAGADDREIAVRGWFTPPPDTYCPLLIPTSPVQPDCRDHMTILRAEPTSIRPSIHIDLDDLASDWWPEVPGNGLPPTPAEIVVIGHFDDRRSTFCPPYVEPECRDRFVVDRVDWVDGASMPLSVEDPLEDQTTATLDRVEGIVARDAPASPVLSIAVVDGQFLGLMEPTLKDGAGGFTANPVIWVVRVLESERVATHLVIDGRDESYVVGSGDEAVAPEVPRTFSLTLTGVPDRPVPLEVVDLTEMVEEAREAAPAEMSRPWPATDGLRIENLTDDTVLVRWTGGVCDRRPRLTVAPDPIPGGRQHRLQLSDARPACDAMGVGRGIVLHFKIGYGAGDLVGTENIELVEP